MPKEATQTTDNMTGTEASDNEATYTQSRLDALLDEARATARDEYIQSLRENKDGALRSLTDSVGSDVMKELGYTTKEKQEVIESRVKEYELEAEGKKNKAILEKAMNMRKEDLVNNFTMLMAAAGASEKAIEREKRYLLDELGFDEDGRTNKSVTDYVESLKNDKELAFMFSNRQTTTFEVGRPNAPAAAASSGNNANARNLMKVSDWINLSEQEKGVYTQMNGANWLD